MNEREKQEAYYDRVRPLIGDVFVKKGLAAYGVSAFPHTVEALVRTGVRRVRLGERGPVEEGPLTRVRQRPLLLGISRGGRPPGRPRDNQVARTPYPLLPGALDLVCFRDRARSVPPVTLRNERESP